MAKYRKRLERVAASYVNEIVQTLIKPVVITFKQGKKNVDTAILMPHTPRAEQAVWNATKEFKAANVSYEEYVKKMMEKGLEQLHYNEVDVLPSHVIAKENLEEIKKQNKLAASGFMLLAWKMMAGHNKAHLCENCGHLMIPQGEHGKFSELTTAQLESVDGRDNSVRKLLAGG